MLSVPIVDSVSLSRPGCWILFQSEEGKHSVRISGSSRGSNSYLFSRPSPGIPGILIPPNIVTLSPLERKQCAHVINAWSSAIIAVWPRCQYGLRYNQANKQALYSAARMMRWVIRCYTSRDPSAVASLKRDLKLISAWLRYLAADCQIYSPPDRLSPSCPFGDRDGSLCLSRVFRGSISNMRHSAKKLLQLSRFARALPPGGDLEVVKAAVDLKSVLTQEFKTNSKLLPLFCRAATLVSRVLRDNPAILDSAKTLSISNSSCYQFSRMKGGATEYARQMILYSGFSGRNFVETPFFMQPAFNSNLMSAVLSGNVPGYIAEHFSATKDPLTDVTIGRWNLEPGTPSEWVEFAVAPVMIEDNWLQLCEYANKCFAFDAFSPAPLNPLFRSTRFEDEQTPYSLPLWDIRYSVSRDREVYEDYSRGIYCGFRMPEPEFRPVSHRVVVVPDRGGFKVRSVSCGEASMTALSHHFRKIAYKHILPRTPTKWGIMDRGVEHFFNQLRVPACRGYGSWVVLSSDLKDATNRFPFDVVKAINAGLQINLGNYRKTPEWAAWMNMSGPQSLLFNSWDLNPKDSDKRSITVLTKRGNLMGTPPSWFHLNMYNYTLIRTSWALWAQRGVRRKLPYLYKIRDRSLLDEKWDDIKNTILDSVAETRNGFSFPRAELQVDRFDELICLVGDDLGGVCPFAVAIIYECLLEMTGGSVSPGKHYVLPAKEGSFLLIAERFCRLGSDGTFTDLRTFSLRGFSRISDLYDTRDTENSWANSGSYLTSLAASIGSRLTRKAMLSFAHVASRDLRVRLLRSGLPVYLPAFAGGMGWPHPLGDSYALARISDKQRLLYHCIRGYINDPLEFAYRIKRCRSTFACSMKGPYTSLLDSWKKFLQDVLRLGTSRDQHGRVTWLVPGEDTSLWIGLPLHSVPSRPLIDVLDCLVVKSLPYRILFSPESSIISESERSISVSARAYAYHMQREYDIRNVTGRSIKLGGVPDFHRLLKEDRRTLESYHVYMGDEALYRLPILKSVLEDVPDIRESIDTIGP